ncbi:MAG TPA: bifunctional glutamate N-acetyltransferase/amino-acid acetyltransferase ArgJ [Caulobacteraceae bacterium]|nr:bifunctional glutamate N-acetyltransferase/amino-acid acetyltransferase ArgJ [Caulobacteraceae bacterium]
MTTDPSAPGKPGLQISPLAVGFPAIPPIGGVELSAVRAGFYKHERDDLMLVRFRPGTSCAGVFTLSKVGSAPVDWCRHALRATHGQDVRALVLNAGCANAFTGKAGAKAVQTVCEAVGKAIGCKPEGVMAASTGVIGVPLEPAKIMDPLPDLVRTLSPEGWGAAARAMMTTDTFPKGAHATAKIDGVVVHIAGLAKGSGMIAPNMATMLAFVVTDADIAPGALQQLLQRGVVSTFNSVTVDGDTSTNDTLLAFATGASGAPRIDKASDRRLADFRAKLGVVLQNLALQLVRDGEGATKLAQITVQGAKSEGSARRIALTIANSPLVKTAIAGEDANWGRIVAAAGRAGEPLDRDKLSVRFGELWAAKDGAVARGYDEAKMSAYMKKRELEIVVDVGVGHKQATVWTCDLTKRYIEINGDYRS